MSEAGYALVFSTFLIVGQAQALSLSEITVRSHLGQPLDAVVEIHAAPGEHLRADCISIAPPGNTAIPTITNVRLSLTSRLNPGSLRIVSRAAMREPMSELILTVDCPGAPRISRTFMVMLDPPVQSEQQVAARTRAFGLQPTSNLSDQSRRVTSASSRIRVHSAYVGPTSPVTPGSEYRVTNGDVLSMIASRVEGREYGSVWEWASRIQRANPQAFLNGDPNILLDGAVLYIPKAGEQPAARRALRISAPQLESGGFREGAFTEDGREIDYRDTIAPGREGEIPRMVDAPIPGVIREAREPVQTASPNRRPTAATRRNVVTTRRPIQAMVLATNLSTLSMTRIQQRADGLLETANIPTTSLLPGPAEPEPTDSTGEPEPAIATSRPQPMAATGTRNLNSGWTWLGLLLGLILGALAGGFGAARWMRGQQAAQERSRRYQEKLELARRQHATPAAAAAPSIVVHESTIQDPATEQPSTFAGLDFELDDTPQTIDVDLLHKDGVAPAADAENEGATEVMLAAGLDLELPEAAENATSIDYGFAAQSAASPDDVLPAMSDETGTIKALDAELLALDYANEHARTVAGPTASEEHKLALDGDGDAGNEKSEDFYHLEASQVLDPGALSFEQDDGDDSKILEFRKRRGKTGTDDADDGDGE